LELDFLGEEKSIVRVCKLLADIDDDKVFSNSAIEAIVSKAWQLMYPRVLKFVFFPYLVYCSCFVGFLIFFFELKTEIQDGREKYLFIAEDSVMAWPLLLVSILYSCL